MHEVVGSNHCDVTFHILRVKELGTLDVEMVAWV